MCTVEKLQIKGIRSFSPENETPLVFEEPLSLIVGHNGAGKTTVIECLKQATTGCMPPNSKNGQYFIHDPKIAGETEVKAQIKLRVRTAQGSPIVIHRSFMLTQQKSKRVFKTLDGSIQTLNPETGELVMISHKCAEIDKMVPFLMNVSRAILENVIFVHQEDSLWPLSESKPLKEKFDAIFAATKYTDALTRMKAIIKEKSQAVREAKLQLEHLKTHKDSAQRLRMSITKDCNGEEALVQKQTQLGQAAERLKQEQDDIEQQLTGLQKAHDKVQRLTLELSIKKQEVQNLAVDVPAEHQAEGTASEYESYLSLIEDKKLKRQQDLENAAQTKRELECQLRALRGQLEQAATASVRLQTEVDAQTGQVKERDAQMRAIAGKHGMTVSGLAEEPISAVAQSEFYQAANGLMQRQNDDAAALTAKLRALERELQQRLSDIGSQLSTYSQNISSNQRDLDEAADSLRRIRASVRILPLPVKLENKRVELADEKSSASSKNLDNHLATVEQRLQAVHLERIESRSSVEGTRSTRNQLANASQAVTRLRVSKEQLETLEAQADGVLAEYAPQLMAALVQAEQPATHLQFDANGAIRASEGLVQLWQTQLSEKSQMSQQLQQALCAKQYECKNLQSQVDKLQQESATAAEAAMTTIHQSQDWLLQSMQESVEEGDCDVAALKKLETVVKDQATPLMERHNLLQGGLSQQHSTLLSQSEQQKSQAEFSSKWVKYARECRGCKVCQRPFSNDDEIKNFVERFQGVKESLKEDIEYMNGEIAMAATWLSKMQACSGHVRQHKRLQEELPTLRTSLLSAQAHLTRLEATAREANEAASRARNELEQARLLRERLALPLQQLQTQIGGAREEVQALAARVGDGVIGDLSAVEAQLAAAEAALRALDAEHEELIAQRSRLQDERIRDRTRLLALEQEVNKLEADINERNRLENQASTLKLRMEELDSAAVRLRASHEPLQREQTSLQAQLAAMQRCHMQQESDTRAAVDALRRQLDNVMSLCKHVNAFEQSGSRQEAERAAVKHRELQGAVMQLEDSLAKEQSKLEKYAAKLQDLQETMRSSRAVLLYLRAREEVAGIEGRLAEATAGARSGGSGYDDLMARLSRVAEEEREAQLSLSSFSGEITGLRKRLADTRAELAQEQYRDIEALYRRKQVEVKTVEMGSRDLDRYCKGLEKALLAYHSQKMEAINQVLKELWQKTYRGQDIDCIQIRAESAESGRSSYNYRVIMFSGGADLDMRGRCSAGQKVLACILIRMALAETFCVNCGVIALDEPTTNLDAANSAALAQALRSIIAMRSDLQQQTERAFQLIVITHDENFATMLGTREYAEFMTRVTKNAQNCSQLTTEPVLAQ